MTEEKTETYEPHVVLFREDDSADNLYIIQSGRVRLSRRVFREDFTVETVGPGYVIGEISIAGGARYSETATALEQVEAVVIDADQLPSMVANGGDVAVRLAERLAQRLTFAHHRLANFAMRTTMGRVMLQLRVEALRAGALRGRSFVDIPWDLPEVLCAEKSAVQQCIRMLSEDGLVDLDGSGKFTIAEPGAFDRKLAFLELRDRFVPSENS